MIDTDAGITGLSETVMKRKTLTIEQSIRQLARYLLGKDPTDIEDHWEKMYRDSFWVGGPMHATAISAVDCALWDILGQSLGAPVHKLMGGPTRRHVPVYCHCPGGATPEDFAANLKACMDRGYHSAKTTLPVFYGAGSNAGSAYSGTTGHIDRSWKETEYLNPSVFPRIREFFEVGREAVGPDFGIAVDCHGRLNLKGAVRLCRELEPANLMFIEEPVPPENHDVLAEVSRSTALPIAAGERWATIHGVRPFLETHAVDILQCDLVNCGGITGLKKIAAMAEAHYVSMAPHNPNGPVATMMNLHFAAGVPNYYQLETIGSDADWRLWNELLASDIHLEEGGLPVPCAPGYGIQLKEEALERYPYVAHDGWR
jgi:galactonate dehydratase